MDTLLFLVPLLGCLAIALGRVTAARAAKVEGVVVGEVSLNFRERMQYHRGAIYSVGGLMLLGALTGYLHAGYELIVFGLMVGLLQVPIRYRFTTQGIALGRLLYRPWTEFAGFRSSKKGVAIVGKTGNGAFWIRATGKRQEEAVKLLSKRLAGVTAARAAYNPQGGLGSIRKIAMLLPVAAVILGLGLTAALADGPDVDPTGTNVGDATDLGGIGIGNGQTFDSTSTDTGAKTFSDAQNERAVRLPARRLREPEPPRHQLRVGAGDRLPGHVHAGRLRHGGDGLLPREERDARHDDQLHDLRHRHARLLGGRVRDSVWRCRAHRPGQPWAGL